MFEKLLAEEIDGMIDDAYERGYKDGYDKASVWRNNVIYFLYSGKDVASYKLKAMFDDWDSLIDYIREEICMGVIKLNYDIKPNIDEREGTNVEFLNKILKNIYVDTFHITTRGMDEQKAELEQDYERAYLSYRRYSRT